MKELPDAEQETIKLTLPDFVHEIEAELWKKKGPKPATPNLTNYRIQISSLRSNLSDMKNTYFAESVLRQQFAPDELAVMESKKMASKELKKERTEQNERTTQAWIRKAQDDKDLQNKIVHKTKNGEKVVDIGRRSDEEVIDFESTQRNFKSFGNIDDVATNGKCVCCWKQVISNFVFVGIENPTAIFFFYQIF